MANLAMVMLGGVIGARFANTSSRVLGDHIVAAFGSFAVAVGIASLFAVSVIHLMGLPAPEVIIAYAPGSVDAMMLLALALHLDPVFVGAHHIMRIIFVSVVMPLLAR